MWPRFALTASLLTCLVLSASCADDGPEWSLTDQALTALADIPWTVSPATRSEGVYEDCRLILSLQLEDPVDTSSPAGFPAGITAENVAQVTAECRGQCPDGRGCKFHHMVESPDPDFASTSCICAPPAVPACRLSIRWALAESRRRVIEEIACGLPEEAPACGLAGRMERDLLEIASFAVRKGMNPESALRAVTIDAAKMIGMEERVGSLEPGKDADLLILRGHPFRTRSIPEAVFIDGELVYQNEDRRHVQ